MYPVSEKYLNAIHARTRTQTISGTITLSNGETVQIGTENIKSGSVEIEKSCVTGEELQFGNAILSELRISIKTDVDRYLFFNGRVTMEYGLMLEDGTWETVPLGKYIIGESEREKDIVSMIAYDYMILLDEEYGGAALYGTPYEILADICERNGMTLANTEAEINALPNGDQKIQVDETSNCDIWRDCVKVVCQLTGTFAVADRDGNLKICQYQKEADATAAFEKSDRYSLTASDFEVSYIGLIIKSSTATYRVYDELGSTGLEMTMTGASAWDYGVEETLKARAETLLGELIQIRYTPSEMKTVSDPRFDCGDRVSIPLDDGTTVESILTKITWKMGNMSLDSTGKNPRLYGMAPKKAQVIRELQAQTEENRLIFYDFTNNAVIQNSTAEPKTIAQVTFVTIKATSAMFLAQLPITVECEDTITTRTTQTEKTVAVKDSTGATATILDAAGNPLTLTVMDSDTIKDVIHGYVDVQVEYYLDGNLVDYELVQRCGAGKHLLSLFYPFESLDANQNMVWAVKIKVAGGSGTITVARKAFKATITGQGLAGTQKWDGTLTFDQEVPALAMDGGLLVPNFAEEVSTKNWEPEIVSLQEIVPTLSTADMLAIPAMEERASVAIKIVQTTIPMAAAEWECEERYVVIESSGIMARMQWEYTSSEQAIDAGRMTAVTARTDDLTSVESVVVKA